MPLGCLKFEAAADCLHMFTHYCTLNVNNDDSTIACVVARCSDTFRKKLVKEVVEAGMLNNKVHDFRAR